MTPQDRCERMRDIVFEIIKRLLCVSRAWSDATEQMTVIGKLFNAAKNGIEKPGWPLQLGGLMLGVDLDLIVEARKGATTCKTAR